MIEGISRDLVELFEERSVLPRNWNYDSTETIDNSIVSCIPTSTSIAIDI